MKKKLILLLILSMGIGMSMTTHAEENQQIQYDHLWIVFNEQLDETEYSKLSDKNSYASSINDLVLENEPVIKVYNEIYWNYSNLPIDEIVENANQSNIVDYIVLKESPIRLRMRDSKGKFSIGLSSKSTSAKWVNDILNVSLDMNILNYDCTVTEIYCFEDFSSHMGATVYYLTTQGTFVKYYRYETSDGTWFTEHDYRSYAWEYYNYLISPENNCNENGEPIGGGTLSFLDFIAYTQNKPANSNDVNSLAPDSYSVSRNGTHYVVGALVCVILIVISTAIILLLKKRKHTCFRAQIIKP